MIWSSAAAASTQSEALESAAVNSSRRPASSSTSSAAVRSEPMTVIGARRRRPKARSLPRQLDPRGRAGADAVMRPGRALPTATGISDAGAATACDGDRAALLRLTFAA